VTIDPAATNGGFSGPLLRLASATVVAGGGAPSSGPGVAPADPKIGAKIRIVFEAEPTTGATALTPTLTNELPNIYINNWSDVNDLNLAQFIGTGNTPCSGLGSSLDIMYTADHELMAAWGVGISSAAAIPPIVPPLPSDTAPPPVATPRGAAATRHLDISAWAKCSYMVTLATRRMLTDGEIDDSGHTNWVTFCKE